jgi:hypothetical protein
MEITGKNAVKAVMKQAQSGNMIQLEANIYATHLTSQVPSANGVQVQQIQNPLESNPCISYSNCLEICLIRVELINSSQIPLVAKCKLYAILYA